MGLNKVFSLYYKEILVYTTILKDGQKFVAIPLVPMIVCSENMGVKPKVTYFCNDILIKDFNDLKQKWETIK